LLITPATEPHWGLVLGENSFLSMLGILLLQTGKLIIEVVAFPQVMTQVLDISAT